MGSLLLLAFLPLLGLEKYGFNPNPVSKHYIKACYLLIFDVQVPVGEHHRHPRVRPAVPALSLPGGQDGQDRAKAGAYPHCFHLRYGFTSQVLFMVSVMVCFRLEYA